MSEKPFLANGKPGSLNSAESWHLDVITEEKGKCWLFFQDNDTDDGKSWYLPNVELSWNGDGWPKIKQ